jgi:prephenate dehydratase
LFSCKVKGGLLHTPLLELSSLRNPWELLAAEDTAGSARYLREQGEVDTAVIASARAATLYDLVILERGIETSSDNSTRFLVLRPSQMLVSEEDALLCFPDD